MSSPCSVSPSYLAVTGSYCVYKAEFNEAEVDACLSDGSYDAQANLTSDSYDRDAMSWTLTVVSGTTASVSSDCIVTFGSGGGEYTIRAATPISGCYDEMTLRVYHVDFSEDEVVTCWEEGGDLDLSAYLADETYDAGRLEWSVTTLSGSNATIDAAGLLTFGNGGGLYRVEAASEDLPTCYDTITAAVVNVDIEAVTFVSDHGLMRNNNSDYTSSGSVFLEPEWVDEDYNYPISHTMDQNVEVSLSIYVQPESLASTECAIVGTGPQGFSFSDTIYLQGGENEVDLTSSDKIEEEIQKIEDSIDWTLSFNGSSCFQEESGPHVVYVTMDTPVDDGVSKHAVTQKRMERAVEQAAAANSLDPHTIIRTVIQAQGAFYLKGSKQNAWTVPDSASDCQSIIRFAQKVLKMINVPGTLEHKTIYAIESAPNLAIEADYPGGLNNPTRSHSNGVWRLALIDGDGGPNAFEATAKFTYDGITKYYAGGVAGAVFDVPDDVLTVFDSLSWITFSNGNAVVEEVIYDY